MTATRTEKEATDAFAEKYRDIVASMTPANWVVLRGYLDMTREEIAEDAGLMLVLTRWKETGPTKQNLAQLMDTPENEIAKGSQLRSWLSKTCLSLGQHNAPAPIGTGAFV